jgi:hypothetical protein
MRAANKGLTPKYGVRIRSTLILTPQFGLPCLLSKQISSRTRLRSSARLPHLYCTNFSTLRRCGRLLWQAFLEIPVGGRCS